jgi:uncharacterized membrane protein YkvA (DUF1232 family)
MREIEPGPQGARGITRQVLDYFRDPGVKAWRKWVAAAAAAYALMPFDAVPDWIPLMGWLDDLGVLSAATWFVFREIKRHARPER